MTVKYFSEILERLMEAGVSKSEMARRLGISRPHFHSLIGMAKYEQKNLKDEQLSALLRLCKEHNVQPRTWAQLGRIIDREIEG